MSAKRGSAPARRMELAVAKKLKGVVTTASGWALERVASVLSPMPQAASASQRASVPLAQPMAKRTAQALAAAFSKASTCGPRMKCCESQTFAMATRISCRSGANWREKSSMGTGCGTDLDTVVMVHRWTAESISLGNTSNSLHLIKKRTESITISHGGTLRTQMRG